MGCYFSQNVVSAFLFKKKNSTAGVLASVVLVVPVVHVVLFYSTCFMLCTCSTSKKGWLALG